MSTLVIIFNISSHVNICINIATFQDIQTESFGVTYA